MVKNKFALFVVLINCNCYSMNIPTSSYYISKSAPIPQCNTLMNCLTEDKFALYSDIYNQWNNVYQEIIDKESYALWSTQSNDLLYYYNCIYDTIEQANDILIKNKRIKININDIMQYVEEINKYSFEILQLPISSLDFIKDQIQLLYLNFTKNSLLLFKECYKHNTITNELVTLSMFDNYIKSSNNLINIYKEKVNNFKLYI